LGTGPLEFSNEETPNKYRINFDSDLTQVFYASFGGPQVVHVSFERLPDDGILIAKLEMQGVPTFTFVGNLTVDRLPTIPWDPDSC
jgi:hypothetical protein